MGWWIVTPDVDRGRAANVAVLLVTVALLAPFVAYAVPQAVGATGSYVVLSGSMEPALQTGGVIYVYDRDPAQIEEGDIVTFRLGDQESEVTTHRVVDVVERDGTRMFVTKGDANEDPDPVPVPPDAVVGVVPQPFGVPLAVPFAGHVLMFARSRAGIVLTVFVPAGLLIASEVWSLYRAASGGGESGSEGESASDDAAEATDGDDGASEPTVAGDAPERHPTSADGGTTDLAGTEEGTDR